MQKNKILILALIIAVIIAFLMLALSGIDLMNLMIKANQWFYLKLGSLGIYIATFIVSIFGNFTVILPVPYIVSIITILLITPVNPLILALFAAAGASLGDMTAWLLGRGTAAILNKKKYMNWIKGLTQLIRKGYAFWLLIIFGATPLPDDILLIALGMENYPLKKTMIGSFIGKFILMLSLILGVVLAKNTIIGQWILYIYGLQITSNGSVKSAEDPLISTLTTIVTIALTLLMIKIDWAELLKKIKGKKTIKKRKNIKV